MRITILTPPDNLTGGIRVVAIYAARLQAVGHDVLVVSCLHEPPTWREHLRALRHGRWSDWRQKLRAHAAPGHIALSGVHHRVLEKPGPIDANDVPDADIVIATWWETAVWMHDLPPSKGRKVHLLQGYEIWWGGAEARDRVHAALRLPNLKVAISSGLKQEIERDLGDLGIHVVRNGVDREQFDAPPRERGSIPTVGFVYAPDLIKGPDRCLRVIEQLRQSMPELHVLAFGAQPPTSDLPLPANTEFYCRPSQQAIPALYARCDVWLFATRVDSFGLPILESMACRTPVVGVAVGAAPDLLRDGAGVLVDAADEPSLILALAEAVERLLVCPANEWCAMSERSHARAHGHSWEDAVDQFEAILNQTVASPQISLTGDPSCGPSSQTRKTANVCVQTDADYWVPG